METRNEAFAQSIASRQHHRKKHDLENYFDDSADLGITGRRDMADR
jgi:hypothetical protein